MKAIYLFFPLFLFLSCDAFQRQDKALPILGHRNVVAGDTLFHTVPAFTFTNQYGEKITNESFADKAYIIDYFFTSCPTICPRVKREELKLYEKYKHHDKLAFMSVSIDTKYDNVDRLSKYAKKLGVEKSNWHFVTGDKDMIYDSAVGFFHTAMENDEAPRGYDHDGKLVLIDSKGHIRGFCDGMIPEEVDDFVYDIENLLNEYK